MGIGGGKSQKHLGCCQTPVIHKLSGFLTSLPSPIPPYSPFTCLLLSKNSMADYKSGLREPEAPAMQIQVLHCCLCPQPRTPLHPLAPPAFPLCSLSHGPIHIAVAAPTTIAITMPLLSLPQPLALRHHPATYPAHAATTMHRQRFQGCRNMLQCHAEGFGWCLALWRGVERVCSPLLGSKAPSVKTHYFMVSSGQRLDV